MKILVDLCSLLSFSVANSLCGVNAPRALERRVLVSILMSASSGYGCWLYIPRISVTDKG